MKFNEVQQRFRGCRDLAGLDDTSLAFLFWRGEEATLKEGSVVYSEGEQLDNTFCVLLSDYLVVEQAGAIIGQISELQIFGEMAYFTHGHERTATVRAGWPRASVLKIKLTSEELETERLSSLKKYLGLQAWERFVNSSQSCP